MTSENKSTAKYFFLTLSVIAHAALIYYIAYKALDYSLPVGQVSSYEMTVGTSPTTPTPITVQGAVPKTPRVGLPPESTPAQKVLAEPKPVAEKAPQGTLPVKEDEPAPTEEKPNLAEDQKEALDKQEASDENTNLPEAAPVPPTTEEAPTSTPQTEPAPAQPEQTPTQAAPAEHAEAAAPAGEGTTPSQGTTGSVQSDAVLTAMPGNAQISYPMMARLRKLEGETVVHYNVDGQGNVTNVQVVQSSGSGVLDDRVVSTIQGWKFKPTGQDGVYERPVKFSLKGEAQQAPGRLRRINN